MPRHRRLLAAFGHHGLLGALVLLAGSLSLAGCTSYSPRPHDATPPAFELRLGPGDRVLVSVRKEDLDVDAEILPDGAITFPLIGRAEIAGLTVDEARVHLAKLLSAHFTSPNVTLLVKETRSHVIHVIGEVARPGSTPYARGATVLGAIQAAGGYIPATADHQEIHVVRDRITTPRVFRVDLEKIFSGEDTDMYLEPGDLIYVPPRGLTTWDRNVRQFFGCDPSERFRQ